MLKRFKLRFPRIFPSFQSCRSKDPSALPENPVPVNHKCLLKLDLPPSVVPAGGHYVTGGAPNDEAPAQDFSWNKEEKWHVVSKVVEVPSSTEVFNSLVSEESEGYASPSPTALLERKKKQRNNKKKKSKRRARISTSSADHSELFSSEVGDDEVDEGTSETLVSSSRTLSTDSSSSVDTHELETIRETPIRGSRRRRIRKINSPARRLRRVKCTYAGKIGNAGNIAAPMRCLSTESVSPARLSVFSWMMPGAVEGKVRESFAVVKKSEDPYEDFKGSMMEMILEKQMVEARELEQLLQCFLSLNSRNHHEIIVEAFSEIWEAMFCESRLIKKLPF